MSSVAVEVDGIGKLYDLGRAQADSLRTAITNLATAPFRHFGKREAQQESQEFWALRDVSFKVEQGEVVGIIGRNGAGKSTLLKVLSRIVEPTTGRAVMRGRVASLLEVGTGFHPELTGRENIYLNGSILGMRKREIAKKFDEIVAFAEVEKFLDTPVKRYSSGMYVRLAFAVAAHLEPEILIVDEVLAVGDTEFQKKCIGKMKDISKGGDRTVLFVSHNMGAVRALCTSGIYLAAGGVKAQGDVEMVIGEYLRPNETALRSSVVSKYGIELHDAGIYAPGSAEPLAVVYFLDPCEVRIRMSAADGFAMAALVVRVYDDLGSLVSTFCSCEEGVDAFTLRTEKTFLFNINSMQLMPGVYSVSVYIYRPHDGTVYLEADSFFDFEVLPAVVPGGMLAYTHNHGVARIVDSCQLI
jgi:lipopolysaccharide transport system ATP-binding protein